jgi:hypothetical protein
VFWDRYILPGKTWREVIAKVLHEARCVVVAWSRASIASSWVHEEAEEGHERKILMPVFFEEVRPPIGFRGIQAASLVNWDGCPAAEEFQQLISAVADILDSPKQPAEPRSPQRPRSVLLRCRKRSRRVSYGRCAIRRRIPTSLPHGPLS